MCQGNSTNLLPHDPATSRAKPVYMGEKCDLDWEHPFPSVSGKVIKYWMHQVQNEIFNKYHA